MAIQILSNLNYPIGNIINQELQNANSAKMAVAFLKYSGVKVIEKALDNFLKNNGNIEIIADRASNKKEKMGLTSWQRSPGGKIMPSDVVIAKNYLDKKELVHLNSIGNMYLDYAELQAARKRAMTMKDWIEKLNAFLKFSEYEILTNAGKISHEVAESLALEEFSKYKKIQDKNYISDFDR